MRLLDPKPGTRFARHHGRLALFHPHRESRPYWRDYWISPRARHLLAEAREGRLEHGFEQFDRLVAKIVPRGSRVLEAGCGLGHVVAALNVRGYDAIGIDFVPEIVEFARAEMPGMDVRAGDVTALEFTDASFDCYVSLGVLEHLEEGPTRALAEARRVVRSGGTAIVEVPFLNPLRRARLAVDDERSVSTGLAFHQYYFSIAEFTAHLHDAGFAVEKCTPNSSEAVLFREHPILAPALKTRYVGTLSRKVLQRVLPFTPDALRRRYAHMMIYTCRAI